MLARPTDNPKTVRLDLRFPPDLIGHIDEWRRHQPDIPPRAEAVRRLIGLGLASRILFTQFSALADIVDTAKKRGALTAEEIDAYERAIVDSLPYGEAMIDRDPDR
jgi:hypothetical protein